MAAQNTTFVLLPGAWHPASCLDPVASRLRASGYQVRSVDLASFGAEPPLDTFAPDVEKARQVMEEEADKGQTVVVFMHSYSGMVGTEACRGLDKKGREAAGKKGGVGRLIYCCAFLPAVGISLDDGITERPAWIATSEDGLRVEALTPERIFYNDMTAEHASEVASTLRPHSGRVFSSKLTHAAYLDVPATYVLCTLDNAIPIAAQEGMVEAARGAGAQVQTVRLEASHSPFCSVPDEVAEACRKSAEGQL